MLYVLQSTSEGVSAIALVELIGEEAFEVAKKFFGLKTFRKDRLYRTIVSFEGQKIDEAVVRFLDKKTSMSCMDTVEFYLHGGKFCSRNLISNLKKCGAKEISVGEYLELLFSWGKIDFIQKEAIEYLLSKISYDGVRILIRARNGELSNLISSFECRIRDNPESANNVVGELYRRTVGIKYTKPARVIILGAPNVGKSSLFNELIGSDRAIVSEIPGTTIDYLEETVFFNGFPITFVDTCGISNKNTYLETLGMKETFSQLVKSDVVLYLISSENRPLKEELSFIESLSNKKLFIVISKSDLELKWQTDELNKKFSLLKTSSLTKNGIEDLKKEISDILELNNLNIPADGILFFTERQCKIIEEIRELVGRTKDNNLSETIHFVKAKFDELRSGRRNEENIL